jgi:hypothetical protein
VRAADATHDQKSGGKTCETRRRETKSHAVLLLARAPSDPGTRRILLRECDNEAVVHNKEKSCRKSQSRQHQARKLSLRPAVVPAAR